MVIILHLVGAFRMVVVLEFQHTFVLSPVHFQVVGHDLAKALDVNCIHNLFLEVGRPGTVRAAAAHESLS